MQDSSVRNALEAYQNEWELQRLKLKSPSSIVVSPLSLVISAAFLHLEQRLPCDTGVANVGTQTPECWVIWCVWADVILDCPSRTRE